MAIHEDRNLIAAAFDRQEKNIADRLANGLLTIEKAESLNRQLDISLEEFIVFNNIRAVAQASDKLNYVESATAYEYMHSEAVFNNAPLHVKVVLTTLFKELIEWKRRQHFQHNPLPEGNGFDHIAPED